MADQAVLEIDLPQVRAEVTACFLDYDKALLAGDATALAGWFFDGPVATRFGISEELYGAAQIAAWRRHAPRLVRSDLRRYDVVTLARDVAVVTAEFDEAGAVGRQSQTWVRSTTGWRILVGHVSLRASA